MTFIQPNKHSGILNKILVLSVIILLFGASWLTVLYNRLVNLNHGLSETRNELRQVQLGNVELKDRALALFNAHNSENLGADNNLIKDKNPQYLQIDSQWSFASQH